jgi:translation initiation factor 5
MMNIGGDPNDRSYRYKMPKLVAKVEGRGNGIKTRIPNCADIASSLHRPPAVVTKFFGCELGAQSKWDDKEQSCIVNGDHSQNVLQAKLVEEFLPRFVLCSQCGLPETDMKVIAIFPFW